MTFKVHASKVRVFLFLPPPPPPSPVCFLTLSCTSTLTFDPPEIARTRPTSVCVTSWSLGLLAKLALIYFPNRTFNFVNFFYGDLVYKLRRVRGSNNVISLGTKIVKRLWRRSYLQGIIEKTIGIHFALLQPCADFSLSIAFWQTRRWALHDGSCWNLRRGDKVPSFVPSDR